MAVKRLRLWMWVVAIIGVVGTIVALNWQWFSLTAAFVLAERRPALLVDAQWNDPTSAQRFSNRFRPGTSEGELLAWLETNEFTVDLGAGQAARLIHSLPCNERVEINWSKTSGDTIASAEARVYEAGCL
jgi:hypothetical protein